MGGLGVGLRLMKLVGVKRGAQPEQAPEGAPLGPGPSLGGSSSVHPSCSPNRRDDQAGETETQHILLQPAALLGPGELHCGAAHRQPGAGLRPPCRQEGLGALCCLKASAGGGGRAASGCRQVTSGPGWGVQSWLGAAAGSLSQPACRPLDSGLRCCL